MKPLRAKWRTENKGWCFEPFQREQERSWWRVALYAANPWLWATSAARLQEMMCETIAQFKRDDLVIGTIEILTNGEWENMAARRSRWRRSWA